MPGKKVAGKCIHFNGDHMKHVIVDMEMNSNLIVWTKCTAEIVLARTPLRLMSP